MYFSTAAFGLQGTYVASCSLTAALGIPFVIITVTANVGVGFDRLTDARRANMGANPINDYNLLSGTNARDLGGRHFRRAVRLRITSFDDVVVVLFVGSASKNPAVANVPPAAQQISPTILASGTILRGDLDLLLTVGRKCCAPLGTPAGMSPLPASYFKW